MSRRHWGVLIVLFLSLFLAVGEAEAQRRGGSFGGGRFGRSSSSSSRSSSSGSWGGSRSSGSRSWGGSRSSSSRSWGSSRRSSGTGVYGGSRSSRRSGGGGFGLGCCCFVAIVGIIGLAVVVAIFRKKKGGGGGGGPGASPGGGPSHYSGPDAMYVNRLSLGIDWRARPEIQQTLTRLAETGDTTSPQGLCNLLRETVLSLRRAELSWLYIAQESQGPMSPQDAEAQFGQMAMNLRSRFQTETVRGWGGDVHQQQGAEMQANKNEGEGTVVVTLLIASYRPLQPMQSPDANQIRSGLDNRAALTADQLGALEVIWSPSDDQDRMSTAELEQNYPEMNLIDPNSIAGRLFCTYCQGPFAMELLNCPHCGAPAEASQNNRAPRGAQ